jgi:predicted DNA-binding protein (MmcQ/YjbR family)
MEAQDHSSVSRRQSRPKNAALHLIGKQEVFPKKTLFSCQLCSYTEAVAQHLAKEMNTQQLKRHCLQFPGAVETLHGAPANILVYSVEGKTYAYFKTSEPERWRFSLRVTPDRFIELTDVPGVKPARFRARHHWVTIVDVKQFPADYLTELLAGSYRRAVESLSKTRQKALNC